MNPNSRTVDSSAMDDAISAPIHSDSAHPDTNGDAQKPETNDTLETKESNPIESEGSKELGSESFSSKNGKKDSNSTVVRRERPTRACTVRPAKYVDLPVIERRPRPPKREKLETMEVSEEEEDEDEGNVKEQCGKVVTSLVNAPTLEQMPRWNLRSMWQLASIFNFLNVFRPLLNIAVEFSAEELESALLNPNATLGDVHIPLLKAIPPVTRMACGRDTWVTVLCRKLRDWWHWVAEGELPIVTNHGVEIETYRSLDPGIRVVILKALCDIRVEQDDIRSYIDNSFKHGVQLSAFRKERIGGDSHGISYWYEDDEIIGHRLYREIRKVEKLAEVKRGKTKGSRVLPSTIYEWETVATNMDEFLDVSKKLFSSKNRTEASLGKKLKNDVLPEIEKIHKRKERLLKKQQREALLLDNFVAMDGIGAAGRSLRDRKPVTYTFDDFDRSINEAIKITKRKQSSPEPAVRREGARSEPFANGGGNGSHASPYASFSPSSPVDYDETDEDHQSGSLDRSNRRRQKSQRYSDRDFVEAISDQDEDYSDDDIVGEAVYDEEYLRQRKHRKKLTSSSEGEGDEEYDWSDENGEDEAEEEEDSLSLSEDSDQPRRRSKRSESTRANRVTKSKSVDKLEAGLRRSKRATRNRVNYQRYELYESENESMKSGMAEASERHSDATENAEYSMESQDSEGDEEQEKGSDEPSYIDTDKDENRPTTKPETPSQDDPDGVGQRKFIDLNELAPGSGFEDGPSAILKDNDGDGKNE